MCTREINWEIFLKGILIYLNRSYGHFCVIINFKNEVGALLKTLSRCH